MRDFIIPANTMASLKDKIITTLREEELSFEKLLPEDPDRIIDHDIEQLIISVLQRDIGDEISFSFKE